MAVQYILPAVLIGFVLDLILGDPPSFVHPVRLIGKSISALEKLLRGLFPRTDRGERLAGLCLVLLVVGMFLDITPACLIFTPIFLPIVQSLGMDLVQFGVVLTFNMCMGTMTPPVGSVLFVSCGISKVPIERVFKPLLPYVGALLIVLLLVTYVPAVSLALPRLMGLV